MFPELLKQTRWKQGRRDLKVGDIVLRKDKTAAGQTYKYAKVVKVYTSKDRKVRAADIEYKLPGESVFRVTTRPIHKLVLVVPAEEQVTTDGQTGEEGTGKEQPAPLPALRPEPEQQKEIEAIEAIPLVVGEPDPSYQGETGATKLRENLQETSAQPARKKQEEPKVVVKYKKVSLGRRPENEHEQLLCQCQRKKRRSWILEQDREKGEGPKRTPAWIHRIRARGVFRIPVREGARTL